jgi:hypothetical protein
MRATRWKIMAQIHPTRTADGFTSIEDRISASFWIATNLSEMKHECNQDGTELWIHTMQRSNSTCALSICIPEYIIFPWFSLRDDISWPLMAHTTEGGRRRTSGGKGYKLVNLSRNQGTRSAAMLLRRDTFTIRC